MRSVHKSVRVQAHSPTLAIARAVLWACTCADLMHAVHSCNALVKMRIFTERSNGEQLAGASNDDKGNGYLSTLKGLVF